MNKVIIKIVLTVLCVSMIAVAFGCTKKEEATKKEAPQQAEQKTPAESPLGLDKLAAETTNKDSQPSDPKDVAVSVDGAVLKKDVLDKLVKEKMNLFKDKIPADKKKEAQDGMKKQLMEEFVLRTILANEANTKKIVATDQEVQAALSQIKANIPPDKRSKIFSRKTAFARKTLL